jgi:hypothetical protein
LAIAARFATLIAEIAAGVDSREPKAIGKKSPAETELIGILYVIPVLFENEETVDRVLTQKANIMLHSCLWRPPASYRIVRPNPSLSANRREPGSFAERPRGMGLSLSLRHVGSEQNSSFRRVP